MRDRDKYTKGEMLFLAWIAVVGAFSLYTGVSSMADRIAGREQNIGPFVVWVGGPLAILMGLSLGWILWLAYSNRNR